jgi:asparagine synthase (glutamine-hydrolysing)
MCAIAGMIGLDFDHIVLDKMLSTMARRGPDERGVHIQEKCCLLHSRLTVVDPEGGKQPMRLSWAGEKYTIVYNGELYNTAEIQAELIKLGHTFESHSDTSAVLHAYAQWGEKCLEKLNGIFAFGVWEHTKKRLFLARDRMGVKPLFYKCHNGGFLFASEIKSLLAYPTVKAELDADGAAELILLGPGRTPGSGVFRGILELEPGCCGYLENGKWNWKRYWFLQDAEHSDTFSETVEKVRSLVRDAIARQMVSDVPLGTFLSGGLDSSIITAVCAGETEHLPTFSLDFHKNDTYFVPGKFQPESDNRYIEIMQAHLNTSHHWTVMTPEQQLDCLYEATNARDLPGMADVDFSLFAFCKEIRKEVKVALSGECADEIFGGYPWYRDPEVRAVDGFPWAQNTDYRSTFLAPAIGKKIDPKSFVSDRYRQTLRESDILPGTSDTERRMKEMVNLNYRWFMQTLLDRKDRMSMYHSLEVRVPFCDYRIAEYLYTVPWEFKDYMGKEKGLLRQAMTGILPEEVLWRKKCPYPKTYDPRYLELVSDRLKELLFQKDAPIFCLVDKTALQGLLISENSWPWYGQLMKLPQTIAYMLQINAWLEIYGVDLI